MATSAQVQQLYIALLGRAADKPGLDWWLENINGGERTLEQAAAAFTTSEEFVSTYGSLQGAELVTAVYSNLFERTPSQEEVTYWVNDGRPADQLLAAFLTYASPADQAVVNNKVFVAEAYSNATGDDYNLDAAAQIVADVNGTAASVSAALNNLPTSAATLTEGLAGVAAANAAKEAFLASLDLDNNGKLDTAKAPAGDGVSLANQETAVGNTASAAEIKLGGVLTAGYTGAAVVVGATNFEGSGNVPYAGAAYSNGSSDTIQDSILATEKLKIAADLLDAQDDLVKVTAEIAKVANLQSAVDAYNSAVVNAVATQKAVNSATAALETAKVAFDAANTTDSSNVAGAAASVVVPAITYTASTGLFNTATVTYDMQADGPTADLDLFTIDTGGVVTLNTATQTDITAAEAASLKAALEAYVAALKNDGDADALVGSRLDTVKFADAASVSNGALVGTALAYNNAKDNVTAIQKLVADIAAAEDEVTAARANTAELKSLQDDLIAANKVLTDAGFAVDDLAANDNVNATAKSDVFTFAAMKAADSTAENATINNFGFAGTDVIDATGYTLGGATGDNAVLEVFFKQVGANTVVTFEESAYGSNASTAETFTITLTGVAATDLVLQDGFIQLA
ncbi:DUF4214 domain-containing protein [Stutzerimonas kunmingensis]|uniref:DUF4214 domain-containing protein n=1 Tax=Stutzerimonas kunmingensis TaxID=1211807 RepID=UPI0028A7C21B|nr:DUF4214 domain-containing protein [Stutzerimonas kunmingensis]